MLVQELNVRTRTIRKLLKDQEIDVSPEALKLLEYADDKDFFYLNRKFTRPDQEGERDQQVLAQA